MPAPIPAKTATEALVLIPLSSDLDLGRPADHPCPTDSSIGSIDRPELTITSDSTADDAYSSNEEGHSGSLANIAYVPNSNTVAFPALPTTPTAAIPFPTTSSDVRKDGMALNTLDPQQYTGKVYGRGSDTQVERHVRPHAIKAGPVSTTVLPEGPPIPSNSSNILVDRSELRARPKPQWRSITPRDTPLCSPATEPESYFSSGSSASSGRSSPSRQSSWTPDGFSFRQRVALKLAAQRDICNQEEATEHSGLHLMLRNGNQSYALSGMIGRGGYGRVMRAYSNEGDEVAIKVIHKAMAYRHSYGRDRIIHELNALKRVTEVDLPFVCPLLCSWSDEKNVYMVMPCLRENLMQRMRRKPLSRSEILLYSAELMHALSGLHSIGIVHRDIKPENIVFDVHGHIVLTDFGLAQMSDTRYETVDGVHLYGVAGTLGYWAPEMVVATNKTGYGWEVDVWALGMVIYEMALNKLVPFYAAKTLAEVKRQMMLEDVPVDEVGDPELADLLSLMLMRNPRARWSAENLKRHTYFISMLDWRALKRKDYEVNQPQCPRIDHQSSGTRFSTFRAGRDRNFPHLLFTSDGEVVPNMHSRALLGMEDPEVDGFKFTMNPHYRKALMPEFTESMSGIFESRYATTSTSVPYTGERLEFAEFSWASHDSYM